MKKRNQNQNQTQNENVEKVKISKQKIATRIIAAILVGMMVLSVGATGIYYLIYVFSAK